MYSLYFEFKAKAFKEISLQQSGAIQHGRRSQFYSSFVLRCRIQSEYILMHNIENDSRRCDVV